MPREPIAPHTIEHAKRMRTAMTGPEARLWSRLRAHRLMGLSFRRQVPIGRYIVDFACPSHRLVIEVDGISHSHELAIASDNRRTAYLQSRGWQVLRFTNDEVLKSTDDCCQHILAWLQANGIVFE